MAEANGEPRWTSYGLRSDPFFSQALAPDEAGNQPIHLFRGRQEAVDTLIGRILNGAASVSPIIAEGGYGKSSLASRVVHDLRPDYLPLPDELSFDHADPVPSFYFEILDGIVRALILRRVTLPTPPKDPAKDSQASYPGLIQAIRLVALYRASNGLQIGASIGPFLIQTGGGQLVQPRYHPRHSRDLLRQVWQDIAGLTGCRGIIVRLNNLDEPFITDRAARVREFLHEARDLLQEPGYHYLICGNRRLADLITEEPRVNSVFGPAVVLEDFKQKDIHDILQARYEHLAINEYVQPVEAELVDALHDIHRGDLRNILLDLRTAVELAKPLPSEPVDVAAATPLLEEHHHRAFQGLSDPEWAVLAAIGQDAMRVTDIAQRLDKTQGRISQITGPLRAKHALEECSGPGNGTYLRLSGSSLLALRAKRHHE